jgi:hypothetical protein
MLRIPEAWPRRMRKATAAAYLDMSEHEFHHAQAVDGFPRPFDRTARGQPVWLKDALDHWLDSKTGQNEDSDEGEFRRRIAARRRQAPGAN